MTWWAFFQNKVVLVLLLLTFLVFCVTIVRCRSVKSEDEFIAVQPRRQMLRGTKSAVGLHLMKYCNCTMEVELSPRVWKEGFALAVLG